MHPERSFVFVALQATRNSVERRGVVPQKQSLVCFLEGVIAFEKFCFKLYLVFLESCYF
jgi:hypothetical protein